MFSLKRLFVPIALLSSIALAFPESQLSKRYNPYNRKNVDYWHIWQSGNQHLRPLNDDWAAKLPATEQDRAITNCTFTQEIPYGDMIDGVVVYRGSIFTWFVIKGFYWNATEDEFRDMIFEQHGYKDNSLDVLDWKWTEPYTIEKGPGGKPMTGFMAEFTFKEPGSSDWDTDDRRYDDKEVFHYVKDHIRGPEAPVWCQRVQRYRGELLSDYAGRCRDPNNDCHVSEAKEAAQDFDRHEYQFGDPVWFPKKEGEKQYDFERDGPWRPSADDIG